MNYSVLKLVVFAVLSMSLSSIVFAIDLYVDKKTKQIYTEPGPNRERLGSFQRVEDAPAKTATPVLPPRNRSAELAKKAETARLISKVDSLEQEIKRSNNIKFKLDRKGLQAETNDGNFKFKVGGRMHADGAVSDNDKFVAGGVPVEADNGTELRRARIAFVSTFYKDWKFKTQVDFADNGVSVKDLKLTYSGISELFKDSGIEFFKGTKFKVTVGNQKQAFSRELQESSNDMMFQERSLMNVLNEPTVDRAIGVNLHGSGKNWTAQTGVYGESVSPNVGSMDEGWGVSGRATLSPINNKDNGVQKLVHLGVAGNFRESSDSGQFNRPTGLRYRYETTHMSSLFPINTGTITTVKNIKMVGAEANAVYGPVSIGGEYTYSTMNQTMGMPSLGFHGWYGEASYSFTGESRTYKGGKFRQLKPKRAFNLLNASDGGIGAWEMAVRVAGVDLNDGAFLGGEMKNFTVALNWYVNRNVRFMFGYDRILDIKNSPLTTRTTGGKPDGLNTFMFRSQIAF